MRGRKEARTLGTTNPIEPQVDHDVSFAFCRGTPSAQSAQLNIVACPLDALKLFQRSRQISLRKTTMVERQAVSSSQ